MRHCFRDQRGTVILFTAVALVALLAMGGFAIDMAYLLAIKGEIQRSLDAGALAGAGKLGFDTTAFATARAFAQTFAGANPHRKPGAPLISLDLNAGNAAGGNIVLGTWAPTPGTFTPSLDPFLVNAVRCQWSTTIPTSFLRVIGINTLPVSAEATAIASPAHTLRPATCQFPMGISSCVANGSPCGAFAVISLTPGGPPPGSNVGTWVGTDNTPVPPWDGNLRPALLQASLPQTFTDRCPTRLRVGDNMATDPNEKCVGNACPLAFGDLTNFFINRFNDPAPYTVTGADGVPVYHGRGWEVFLPIFATTCPAPGPISGNHPIAGWSRFIITQVINNVPGQGTKCVVDNPSDPLSAQRCALAPANPSWRAVFGYTACGTFPGAPPGTLPGPGVSLSTRLRLAH
jgi:Flp pilus assembly protein TadG